MVRTSNEVVLDDDEQAIVDAFDGERTSTIVKVVRSASQQRPASRVREAYWELVSEGVLIPSASGAVQLRG